MSLGSCGVVFIVTRNITQNLITTALTYKYGVTGFYYGVLDERKHLSYRLVLSSTYDLSLPVGIATPCHLSDLVGNVSIADLYFYPLESTSAEVSRLVATVLQKWRRGAGSSGYHQLLAVLKELEYLPLTAVLTSDLMKLEEDILTALSASGRVTEVIHTATGITQPPPKTDEIKRLAHTFAEAYDSDEKVRMAVISRLELANASAEIVQRLDDVRRPFNRLLESFLAVKSDIHMGKEPTLKLESMYHDLATIAHHLKVDTKAITTPLSDDDRSRRLTLVTVPAVANLVPERLTRYKIPLVGASLVNLSPSELRDIIQFIEDQGNLERYSDLSRRVMEELSRRRGEGDAATT